MPYITREDGQHFVIPSYRDVLTVKQKSQLKKEVLLLSKSYGDYITLQKKSTTQYEVAFSPDTGYLLGESIWHHFKKPEDMIYCEAIPNTTEAILVIVKSGSVYLDGSFPLDSIPEELIIFLTQQNNFEIYTYGDVPITKEPTPDKFSFEASSVKSFTVLDKPAFPSLPLLKIYQLKLVESVLQEQGIGVFPLRPVLTAVGFLFVAWLAYSWLTSRPPPPPPEVVVDPYLAYYETLRSPAPDDEINKLASAVNQLLQISGWFISGITYENGVVSAAILSQGGTMTDLYTWADAHKAVVGMGTTGISVSMPINSVKRTAPKDIYSTQRVVAAIIDRLAKVVPGNNMKLTPGTSKGVYNTAEVVITVSEISPALLALIGKQFAGLPVVFKKMTATIDDNGNLTGLITIDALGN